MSQPRPLLSPPETEEQLLAQAQQLSGYTLGELAALAGLVTPENLKRDKGWIGVLLEIWLGASAGGKPATCATSSNACCGYRLKASAASRWQSVA